MAEEGEAIPLTVAKEGKNITQYEIVLNAIIILTAQTDAKTQQKMTQYITYWKLTTNWQQFAGTHGGQGHKQRLKQQSPERFQDKAI